MAETRLKRLVKWAFATFPRRIVSSLLIILLVLLPVSNLLFTREAQASWWDERWLYRRAIPVSNASGSDLSDFQVKVLDDEDLSSAVSAGKIQSDLDDLRFTDQSGNALPYWIEDDTPTSVDVWAKLPSVPTSGATVYMYYGNSAVSAGSDGGAVFEFFDDFEGTSISRKWTHSGGSYSVSDSEFVGTGPSDYVEWIRTSEYVFSGNGVIEFFLKPSASYADWDTGISVGEWKFTDETAGGNNMAIDRDKVWGDYTHTSEARSDLNYHNYRVLLDGSTAYFFDDTDGRSNSYAYGGPHSPPAGSLYLFSDADGVNRDAKYDWIFVRKYASSEPASSAPAAEEIGPGPVAYWSFDEGYGTTAHDGSGREHDGTITGATWKPESECVSGSCLSFDGTDDWIDGGAGVIPSESDVSISAWVYDHGTGRGGVFQRREASPYNGFHFGRGGSDTWTWSVTDSSGVQLNVTVSQVTGEWVHWVGTYDNTAKEIRLYKNGALVGSDQNGSFSGNLDASTHENLRIARRSTAYLNAALDEIKIYPYARSAEEVAQDYNTGVSGMGTSGGSALSLGGDSLVDDGGARRILEDGRGFLERDERRGDRRERCRQ